MRAQSWTDIMILTAVMVASNKHDPAVELARFKQAAMSMRDMIGPNITLTDALAESWWTENRQDILLRTSSVHYEATVKSLLKNLNVLPNKKAIITALMKATLTELDETTSNGRVIHRMNKNWNLGMDIAC